MKIIKFTRYTFNVFGYTDSRKLDLHSHRSVLHVTPIYVDLVESMFA